LPATKTAVDASNLGTEQEYEQTCISLREEMEKAYKLIQQIQSYDWGQFEGLVWEYTDEQGNEQLMAMSDMLPPADTLEAFLKQCDICNALAVKLSMENSAGHKSGHFSTDTWQTRHQLEAEISKAREQANNIRLDADTRFAEVQKSLTSSSSRANERFGWAIVAEYDKYIMLVNNTASTIEKAEQLVTKLSHLHVNPFALNLP